MSPTCLQGGKVISLLKVNYLLCMKYLLWYMRFPQSVMGMSSLVPTPWGPIR